MKPLLIIGLVLIIVSILLAIANSKPMTSLSPTGSKVFSYSLLTGFILIAISGVLYLKS